VVDGYLPHSGRTPTLCIGAKQVLAIPFASLFLIERWMKGPRGEARRPVSSQAFLAYSRSMTILRTMRTAVRIYHYYHHLYELRLSSYASRLSLHECRPPTRIFKKRKRGITETTTASRILCIFNATRVKYNASVPRFIARLIDARGRISILHFPGARARSMLYE
jgi:hypothetical protein